MIINFRKTKEFTTHFLIAASILANVYAITALNQAETSLAGCESYIEQIQQAQQEYATLFGEAE